MNAAHTLKLGPSGPTDTACFHAQQCVEKYLKALLVLDGTDFPKTHDIGELVALVRRGFDSGLSSEEQRRLTIYATVTRYPGSTRRLLSREPVRPWHWLGVCGRPSASTCRGKSCANVDEGRVACSVQGSRWHSLST